MGSNAINLEEDLCCPVCKKSLSSPGTPPKPKFNKQGRAKGHAPHLHSSVQARRDTRMAVGKFKDNEEIVVAQCGHLFHKFCLRHYCYLVREGRSNHMYKVCCPWCNGHISMQSQSIDYRAHQDKPNDRDKDFTRTSVMNNELSGQMSNVQQKLDRVNASIEEANNNFEVYRAHWRKLKKELKQMKGKRLEIETLYSEVDRSEQMLKCMQSQQLKIVRKFILKVKEKNPKDYIHFPRRLAPFLNLIEEDDRLVRDLGEIIVPIHLNHLKSDRQSLLKGIIATVQERLVAQGKSADISLAVTPEQPQPKKNVTVQPPKKPAIFVKVRKSSISILSSTSLTRESIQQIIQSVDIPLPGKHGGQNLKKKTVQLAEDDSNKNGESVSASGIKVLFMPHRKMVEQTSEPCRTIEESESCAQVPARKCRSTDAVLVKTKKKRTASTGCKVKASSKVELSSSKKRSSTAAVILVQAGPSKNESIEVADLKEVSPATQTREDKEIAEVSVIDAPDPQCDSDFANNNDLESTSEDKHVSTPTDGQSVLTAPDAPKETTSVLKLIYDNLEEEKKSTQNLQRLDENNNELLYNMAEDDIHSNRSDWIGDIGRSHVPPQFFRIDARGMVRPESPQISSFRQPSFLSSFVNRVKSDKSFTVGWYHPDEENQLDALTTEEKNLIVMEREAYLFARRHCNENFLRRPMFHGTPACMGMADRYFNSGISSTPQFVPFYLKKWQQQLPSRKVTTNLPQCFKSPPHSTRLTNPPTCPFSYRQSYVLPPSGPHVHSGPTCSTRKPSERPSPAGAIHLPPVTMYPAKRPATAQCDETMSSYLHREGPEKEFHCFHKYNYDNNWK